LYTSSQIRELLSTVQDDENLSTVEERVDIQRAIAALPSSRERLVVFALLQGYSDIQAGAMLGLRTTAARALIRQVLRQLRDAMNRDDAPGRSSKTGRD